MIFIGGYCVCHDTCVISVEHNRRYLVKLLAIDGKNDFIQNIFCLSEI